MIRKKKLIEYLVEECYSKYPKFIERVPKECLYEFLERNISKVKFTSSSNSKAKGWYSGALKQIVIYDAKHINENNLNENEAIVNTLAHECIHAISRKSSSCCGVTNNSAVFNIKGYKQLRNVRFYSSKSLLTYIKNLVLIIPDFLRFSEFGRAFNEGITEWLKGKCLNGATTYFEEVTIIEQFENIIGPDNIIDMLFLKGKRNYSDAVNMGKKDFVKLCNLMDTNFVIKSFKDYLTDYKNAKKHEQDIEHINNDIEEISTQIQKIIINKVLIPYFSNNTNDVSENLKKGFKSINLIEDYMHLCTGKAKVFQSIQYTPEYIKLKKMIDIIAIKYANNNLDKLSNWDLEKIKKVRIEFERYGIVDNKGYNTKEYNRYLKFINELDKKSSELTMESIKKQKVDKKGRHRSFLERIKNFFTRGLFSNSKIEYLDCSHNNDLNEESSNLQANNINSTEQNFRKDLKANVPNSGYNQGKRKKGTIEHNDR